jgi:hypothetical protein
MKREPNQTGNDFQSLAKIFFGSVLAFTPQPLSYRPASSFFRRGAAGAVKCGKTARIRILASAQNRKPLFHRRNFGCLRGDDLFCQSPRERVFSADK